LYGVAEDKLRQMIKLRELAHSKPRSDTLGGDKLLHSSRQPQPLATNATYGSVLQSLRELDIG
jgi:hypothetical protein